MRWRPELLVALALAACAAPARPGSEVRVEVLRMMTPQELDADAGRQDSAELRRREMTGLRPFVGAGRVVVTRCAVADDEAVYPLPVLAEGMAVVPGALLVVRLGDRDSGELDRVVGPITQPVWLVRGSMPWADALEPVVAAQYHRMSGGLLLRCRAG